MHRQHEKWLMQEHGPKWTLIGGEVGRLPQLCRDRWRRIGVGEVDKGRWLREDEDRLHRIVSNFLAAKERSLEAAAAAAADPTTAATPPSHTNGNTVPAPPQNLEMPSGLEAGNPEPDLGARKGRVSRKSTNKVDSRMIRDDIDWDVIARQMQSRNASQCMEKWYMKLRPSMTETGEWSRSDDKQLLTTLWKTKPKFVRLPV